MSRTRLAALASFLVTVASSNFSNAGGVQNQFVQLRKYDSGVVYLDAASAKRSFGTIEFTGLEFHQMFSFKAQSNSSTIAIAARPMRTRISCDLRTIRTARSVRGFAKPDAIEIAVSRPFDAQSFITAGSGYEELVNRLCADQAGPITGLTLEAAWESARSQVPSNESLPPPMPVGRRNAEPIPGWLDEAHRFVLLASTPAADGKIYLDQARLERRGDSVSGVSLTVLRSDRPDLGDSAAAMRLTSYNCVRKTLTVQSEAVWNGYGALSSLVETVGAPRGAAQSRVASVEIAAACNGKLARRAQAVPDAIAAISTMRMESPSSRRAWTANCLWESISPPQRVRWIDLWDRRHAPMTRALPQDVTSVAAACGVPSADGYDAAEALRQKAIQWSVVQRVINRYGSRIEERILTAWRQVPEEKRRRFAQPLEGAQSVMASEVNFQIDISNAVGQSVGLRTFDDQNLLTDYLKSQSILEFYLRVED